MRQVFVCANVILLMAAAAAAKTVVYDISGSGRWGDTSRWVGGVVPGEGDTVEIPAGKAVVNDDDYPVYKLVKINMTSPDSVLSIAVESQRNPFPLWQHLSGTGLVEKVCARDWVLGKYMKDYKGDWDIQRGGVSFSDETYPYLGDYSKTEPASGRVYVRSGAFIDTGAFACKSGFFFGYKDIHIAGCVGQGFQNATGALHCAGWGLQQTNAFSRIVLEDDAYITGAGDGHVYGLVGLNPELPGLLDLKGHDLYLTSNPGRKLTFRLKNVLVTNSVPASGGNIFLEGGSVHKKHILRIDNDVVFDENVKIRTDGYGEVAINNNECRAAVRCNIVVSDEGPDLSVESPMSSSDTNRTEWAGSIDIPAGETFVSGLDDSSKRLLISGKITGAGDVSMREGDKGQVILGGDVSKFTGNVKINGRQGFGSFMALKPDAIPPAERITVDGSTLVVPLANWTLDQYFNLANGVNYSNYVDGVNSYISSVTMSLEGSGKESLDLTIPDGKITDYENVAVGLAGEGTVNVKGLPSEGRVNFVNRGGTIRFSGTDPFKLGRMLVAGFRGAETGAKVEFDGVTADLGTNEVFVGGLNGLGPSDVTGEMSIRNSLVYTTGFDGIPHEIGFGVGMSGEGRLVVENSCVTGRLHMAGTADSFASVILKGGKFTSMGVRGSGEIRGRTIISKKGHGYLEIDGCDVNSIGHLYAGYDGSAGVVVQKSGSLRIGPEDSPYSLLHIGTHKGEHPLRAVGQFWLKGGTVWVSHRVQLACDGSGGPLDHGTTGILTVEGDGTCLETDGQNIRVGVDKDSVGILNLNDGGKVKAKNITGSNRDASPGKSYVNFNGGIYNYMGWGDTWLFGKEGYTGNTAEAKAAITRITVHEKGGEILFTSSDKGKLMGRPIDAPSGNGVETVEWSDTAKEFPVCPAVTIEGDGYGASAMAVYDSATRTVSGITVTSPGCDYTEAMAVVRVGAETNLYTLSCGLAPNDQSGGMTFRHTSSGSVVFDQANTYKGQTTLMGASASPRFVISNENAFAASSAIALKGGTLNLKCFTLADLKAPLKFMGGAVEGESGSYQIPEGRMVIDCRDLLAGEKYTVENNGNLILPDTVTVLNSGLLDERQDYELLALPADYTGKELFFSGISGSRYVKRYGAKYRLCYRWGTVISFR